MLSTVQSYQFCFLFRARRGAYNNRRRTHLGDADIKQSKKGELRDRMERQGVSRPIRSLCLKIDILTFPLGTLPPLLHTGLLYH